MVTLVAYGHLIQLGQKIPVIKERIVLLALPVSWKSRTKTLLRDVHKNFFLLVSTSTQRVSRKNALHAS